MCSAGDRDVAELADDVIAVPDVPEYLQPLVVSVPLQLLAYEIALLRGCDVPGCMPSLDDPIRSVGHQATSNNEVAVRGDHLPAWFTIPLAPVL